MKNPQQQLKALAAEVVRVLDERSHEGCRPEYATWRYFENGNAEVVGPEIEALIDLAKSILRQPNTGNDVA